MELVNSEKTVAIAIVTWNSSEEIEDCLRSLQGLPKNWQVWVVDNNSADNTVEIVQKDFPNVNLIINKDNVGFAAANNQVIRATKTDYVLLLNPDTISEPTELIRLLEKIEANPKIGVIGCKLHDGNGNTQVICEHFPYWGLNFINGLGLYRFFSAEWKSKNLLGEFFDYESESQVQWFVGACMLARREAIEKVGPVPEDYFMFAEAMHWCYLMWQNDFEVWYTGDVQIIHKKNRSAGKLPQNWRVEKSTLCKYVFCYGQFGWLKTKFIVLTDILSNSLGIWRLMFRNPEPLESKSWKMSREIMWKALTMGQKETASRQQEMIFSVILSFISAISFL
ncbi:MAG: glycosyltransferase family 2 protein [Pyrinomonadaceae bacterium]|nr:glycosyltransferase family 2 protein [Pyrinomonadaceae bacterium]